MQDPKQIKANDQVYTGTGIRTREKGTVEFVTTCGRYARVRIWRGKRFFIKPYRVEDLEKVTD